ncbi:DNA/RNA helicase domain-containing protein [Vibrio furnissii]|uniref:DNA/RNA helicase domain-containing protein n=1 Tax=Vibrio furnissii TaxID=29494 RepID=UPI003AA934BF
MEALTGWSGTWQDFLASEQPEFIETLRSFYSELPWTKTLSPSQLSAWETEYSVMKDTLRLICQQLNFNPSKAWIAFEQELVGEGGKRAADVNIVLPSGDLFVVEFKHKRQASEHEIWRALFDLKTMLRFHSQSIGLKGHCFLALTLPGATPFNSDSVTCDIPVNGVLETLADSIQTALNVWDETLGEYDIHQWQRGQFYRQPSILHGTVQVFFEQTIPTLKTSAGENIEQARESLVKLYDHAKKHNNRYVILVHGRPGAGKTLLGISAVADLVNTHGAEACKPVFLSGNGPLVKVLQYTLDFYGKQSQEKRPLDGRVLIEDLVNFKRSLKSQVRNENFVVFDEAQRAWERVNRHDPNSNSELHLFCDWLVQQEFGVLVLLVGDGQAIHDNEMSLDRMLMALDDALLRHQNRITAIMPELHAHHLSHPSKLTREVFNLKTPIRQSYTEELDQWIEAVLNGEAEKASFVSQSLSLNYPLMLTNEKEVADAYAIAFQKTLHEDNKKSDAFRMGWLMSSNGGEFIPEINKQNSRLIGPWYVDPPASEYSCCQLKSACTEFASQGLELSLALFNWGQDLQYREGQLTFHQQNRRKQDHYTFGAYRVLLSRGRNGLIIKCDDVETYQYLKACGMRELVGEFSRS